MSNKIDPLSVQISFRVKKPKGTEISRKALNDLYLHWVETGELPRNMEIRGIFWKNSDRREPLNFWRYSKDSDLSVIIKNYKKPVANWDSLTEPEKAKIKRELRQKRGVENEPRGDHELARETLQNALRTFRPF